MNPVELIEKKRDGKALSEDEIQWLIDSYTRGVLPDYQMSALLMAIYFQGMDRNETLNLTRFMIHSGECIDLSAIDDVKIDKHSTGGVGDKVSLVLAPLMAAAGIIVPMMAGRGLGHTGGTLDKLEAIPGFRIRLTVTEFVQQLQKIGCAIMGQTKEVAPADRKLYALRDVTGTVPSIPLICGSIISKKKAEGTDGLVLDVKIGEGAFFLNRDMTYKLARALVDCGNAMDIRTQALITNMDQPLGNTIGNWLEVLEAMDTLRGNGPDDLIKITLALGSVMWVMAGRSGSYSSAYTLLEEILRSGRAWDKWISLIENQGGETKYLNNPEYYEKAQFQRDIVSVNSGYIQSLPARPLGLAAMTLGAGRFDKSDRINHKAGIRIHKKVGDRVETGTILMTLYTDNADVLEETEKKITGIVQVSSEYIRPPVLLEKILTGDAELDPKFIC